MANGAAPPAVVTCVCGVEYSSFVKVCPACRTCSSCKRVGKKWFVKR